MAVIISTIFDLFFLILLVLEVVNWRMETHKCIFYSTQVLYKNSPCDKRSPRFFVHKIDYILKCYWPWRYLYHQLSILNGIVKRKNSRLLLFLYRKIQNNNYSDVLLWVFRNFLAAYRFSFLDRFYPPRIILTANGHNLMKIAKFDWSFELLVKVRP